MNAPNRRLFLLSASAATLGGCASSTEALRMFVYSGGHDETIRQVFIPRFKALTGKDVALTAGWWEGIAKVKASPAGKPPFDLMITDATQGYPAAKEGLFESIDFTHVPNVKDLAPVTLDNWVFKDKLGLTYPDAVMTFAHGRDVPKIPRRWADLADNAWTGRLGFYQHFYMSLYTFAVVLADTQGKAGTARELLEKQPDEVMRFARAQSKRVKLWWKTTSEMIQALAQKGVDGGNMHSPEYLQAMRENPDLAAVVPNQDRAFVQVFWAIPAGCPRKSLAHAALNLLMSREVQLDIAKRGSATSRLDVAELLGAEDPLWASLYPHSADEFRQLLYYPYDFYARDWDALTDEWQRTVLDQK